MSGISQRKTIYDGEVEVPYVSAGLGCNNPTAQLLVEAGHAYPGWATACVFSAGAGQLHTVGLREPKRVRLLGSVSSQLSVAAAALVEDCERVHQEVAVRFSHIEGLYFRFNPEQGMQDIDQFDLNRLPDVQTHTKAYLAGAATSGRLNEAVEAIINGKGETMLLNDIANQLPIGKCPHPSTAFTGRKDILESLRAYFFDQSSERHLFVLHGLGGAGKTQLALAFVHRYKKLFWDVFYIDATTHNTIKAGLKQIVKKAKAGDTHEDALEWLTLQEKRWLLVYNNADDPDIDLSDYFPSCAHGDILITTRNREMIVHTSAPTSHCHVEGMPEDDARNLLFKMTGEPKTPESEMVATCLTKQLGSLALAIVQAGAYMRSTQCTITNYLDLLALSRDQLLARRVGQTDGYKLTAYATWDISYRRLMPQAAQLLGIMSFMHHDGISVHLFKTAATNLSQFKPCMPLTTEESIIQGTAVDFLKSLMTSKNTWNPLFWEQLTTNLRSFSLLDYDPINHTYSMHPLVHSWCRSIVLDPKSVREQAAWVLGLCVNWRRSCNDHTLERLLLPHAMTILATNEPMSPPLAERLGLMFQGARQDKPAEELYLYALKASQQRLGSDHILTFSRMSDLGSSYYDQCRWEEAEALLVEVLVGHRHLLGKGHVPLLDTMFTLASVYEGRGRWNEAEAMLLEVLEVQVRVLGKEHPDVLSTMYTLAQTYNSQGRRKEAEAMLLELLEADRRVLGKEHPHLLSTMYTLASTYQSQGRWSEAEVMLLEVLEVRRRVLGKEHPDLLSTMSTLASTYQSQGRWDEAEVLLVEVIEVWKRKLGKEHPNTMASISLLASVYWSQGRLSDAELLEVDHLETSKRVLGSKHPDTLTYMHNLAFTYRDQGKLVEAERLMVEALELRKQVIGEQHPDTRKSAEFLEDVQSRLAQPHDS